MKENNYYKNKVAWCPICGQGWVEILKEKTVNNLFICCGECEARWEHPEEVKDVDRAIPISDNLLLEDPTDDEIKDKGWDRYILLN